MDQDSKLIQYGEIESEVLRVILYRPGRSHHVRVFMHGEATK